MEKEKKILPPEFLLEFSKRRNVKFELIHASVEYLRSDPLNIPKRSLSTSLSTLFSLFNYLSPPPPPIGRLINPRKSPATLPPSISILAATRSPSFFSSLVMSHQAFAAYKQDERMSWRGARCRVFRIICNSCLQPAGASLHKRTGGNSIPLAAIKLQTVSRPWKKERREKERERER